MVVRLLFTLPTHGWMLSSVAWTQSSNVLLLIITRYITVMHFTTN